MLYMCISLLFKNILYAQVASSSNSAEGTTQSRRSLQVDPLRSLAKGRPEFGAFRAYPPEYTAPLNETPDGKVVTDDTQRVERWGTCWDRYCSLEVEYFMSSLASTVMGKLTENFLWMRALSSTPLLEREVSHAMLWHFNTRMWRHVLNAAEHICTHGLDTIAAHQELINAYSNRDTHT